MKPHLVFQHFLIVSFFLLAPTLILAGPPLPRGGVNALPYRPFEEVIPFTDLAHMAVKWFSNGTLALTETGYPAELAAGQRAQAFLLRNGGNFASSPDVQYLLQWEGEGNIFLEQSGAALFDSGTGWAIYDVPSPDPEGIWLTINETNPSNPVSNVSLIAKSPKELARGKFDVKSTIQAPYLEDFQNYGVTRMMDWNGANDHSIDRWEDRIKLDSAHWGNPTQGVPYELQIELCNEANTDCWLTVPHAVDDNYVAELAGLVKANLDSKLRVWLEYSNEAWNGQFQQQEYMADVLVPQYGIDEFNGPIPNGHVAYGRRAAEVFDVFTQAFGSDSNDRLITVLGGQAVEPAVLERGLLGAAMHDATAVPDALAIAPYASIERTLLRNIYDDFRAIWSADGSVEGGDRETLFDAIQAELVANINERSVAWAEHVTLASELGIELVAYEAGQSLLPRQIRPLIIGEPDFDEAEFEAFVEFLADFNLDDRMGQVYNDLTGTWDAIGGSTMVFYNDRQGWTEFGFWGLKDGLSDEESVKYQAVQDFLRSRSGQRKAPSPIPEPNTLMSLLLGALLSFPRCPRTRVK